MFWILDIETDTPAIAGSIKKVGKHTKINTNSLYEHFSRKKEFKLVNDKWRIEKIDVFGFVPKKPKKVKKSKKVGGNNG